MGKIKSDFVNRLVQQHPKLNERIWTAFAQREFDNCLRGNVWLEPISEILGPHF